MKELVYHFSGKKVTYYVGAAFADLEHFVPGEKCILITDETIYRFHEEKFKGYLTIVIPAGEQHKTQQTADHIINQLIEMEATRKTFLVGIGGGVVTDITGYVASVYMRGISFGFIPTTILGQVDASIGGKNGVDVGMYKNLVGVIRQPEFILFDFSLLVSLPDEQWVNGFAEIIKHACIRDESLFTFLEKHSINDFQQNGDLLAQLIERNIVIKSDIVEQDEFEDRDRKLLNFGHTLGHAIENVFTLLHGHAVSVGMVAAAEISVDEGLLTAAKKERIVKLLKQYHLPVSISIRNRHEDVLKNLKLDKKRSSTDISFILLEDIGKARIKPISISKISELIHSRFQPLHIES
jgi:3-dehydroquinate synthase